jgi:hypothetical protein
MALTDKPIPADMPDAPAGQPDAVPPAEEEPAADEAAGAEAANAVPANAARLLREAQRAVRNRAVPQAAPKQPQLEGPAEAPLEGSSE